MRYKAEFLLPKQYKKEPLWKRKVFLVDDGSLKLFVPFMRADVNFKPALTVSSGNADFYYINCNDIRSGCWRKIANTYKARIRRELEKIGYEL